MQKCQKNLTRFLWSFYQYYNRLISRISFGTADCRIVSQTVFCQVRIAESIYRLTIALAAQSVFFDRYHFNHTVPPKYLLISQARVSKSRGFAICPFMPADTAFSISSTKASAVIAIIGTVFESSRGRARIARAAS